MSNAPVKQKVARTAVPLHPLLAERWSPRSFLPEHELSEEQLTALLEAARWAPSASNSQPWRFAVALRGTRAHADVLRALAPGNRRWAGAASALIVVSCVESSQDHELPWAAYDSGQAVAMLTVQAQHEGLAVHQMGGFDVAAIRARLGRRYLSPLVVVAVGRLDEHCLGGSNDTRGWAERQRRPLSSIVIDLSPVAGD